MFRSIASKDRAGGSSGIAGGAFAIALVANQLVWGASPCALPQFQLVLDEAVLGPGRRMG